MNKVKELTRRIEALEQFKEEYDIKMLEEKAENISKEMSKMFNLKIDIIVLETSNIWPLFYQFPKQYTSRLFINSELIHESKKYNSEKEAYKEIEYRTMEDKIKVYLYDNKPKSKVGRPKKGSSK